MSKTIVFETKGNVAVLRLNRPDKYNSFNKEMALHMQSILDECQNNELIRCVYITGEGKAFCAGQDLGEVVDPDGPELEKIVLKHYNPIVTKIRNLDKPVVAAVNGVAAGAGANIALACDVVVAHENASFIQAFSKIGLIPDSGGTYTLPRIIGFQRASALIMLGDKVGAKEAFEMGMVYKCFASDEFEQESFSLANKLANMPTYGLALTKRALNKSMENNFSDQLKVEHQLQTMAGNSHDYNEGVSAFLEKRKPKFIGK